MNSKQHCKPSGAKREQTEQKTAKTSAQALIPDMSRDCTRLVRKTCREPEQNSEPYHTGLDRSMCVLDISGLNRTALHESRRKIENLTKRCLGLKTRGADGLGAVPASSVPRSKPRHPFFTAPSSSARTCLTFTFTVDHHLRATQPAHHKPKNMLHNPNSRIS
jgi:hypothetical protein